MPIYEYQCAPCHRRSSFLVRHTAARHKPECPHCGSRDMVRSLSRFAAPRRRSGGVGTPAAPDLNESSDAQPDFPIFGGSDDADPRTLGRRMRNLVDQTGEAVEPEMDEVIRQLENGEDPEKIENRMSDTFPDSASGGDSSLYDGR